MNRNNGFRKSEQQIKLDSNITFENTKFKLIGAIKHEGYSTSSGHYVYVKFDKDGKINKVYSDVNISGSTTGLEENAYVILYEKTDEKL